VACTIPERVVVRVAVVDQTLDGHPLVVDGVAVKDVPVQLVRETEAVVRLVD
jgi:hypothetical protein